MKEKPPGDVSSGGVLYGSGNILKVGFAGELERTEMNRRDRHAAHRRPPGFVLFDFFRNGFDRIKRAYKGIREPQVFQTAYDFATANTFSRLPIRRRGGRFGRLTQEQLSYLKYFISHFTLGEVKARPYPVVKWQKNSPLTVPLPAPEAQPSDRTFDLW